MQQVKRDPQLLLTEQRSFVSNAMALTQTQTQRMPIRAAGSGPVTRAQRAVTRAWVLNPRWFVYAFAGILIAVLAAGLFQSRGGIMSASANLGHVLSGRFAAAGLGISEMVISGQALTQETEIAAVLAIEPNTTIFSFDPMDARLKILELPAVSEALVRKVYPSQIIIEITEKQPVARWRIDGVTFLIDSKGEQLAIANPADDTLPLVIGDGAADDAAVMIAVLERHPTLHKDLAALSRIADRRWDFIYATGLRVQMPERGFAQALNLLERQQAENQILDRDLDVIDLRLADLIALTPTKRDEE